MNKRVRVPRKRGGWVSVLAPLLLVVAGAGATTEDFPRPAALESQIRFWEKVFAEWSEHQVAIHDNLYLDRIYSVVDLRPEARAGVGENALWNLRQRRTEDEKKRIHHLLGQLHAKRNAPERLNGEEKRIFEMFEGIPGDRKFLEARERIRAQQGLLERFRTGIEISRRYLPYMEEIFRQEGLPLELTRMPFVESTFNIKAYSKVGAAGIWQFIPSSARIYGLRMNEIVDDRRDPLLATRAAARHLKDDHARLGSWPLAVTAYNHGRGGIARAVREVGRPDLVEIIRRYRGRSFGFASRNFYVSFLAALEVERDYEKHFGPLQLEPKLDFGEVFVPDFVRFGTLARLAGMSAESFHELNPAFERVVVDGKLYVPGGSVVRIPAARAETFRSEYAKLGADERFAAQRLYYVEHRVQPGQTVGAIAGRYRTTVASIQAANNLQSVHRVRAGQVLKIPTGNHQGAPPPPSAVARAPEPRQTTGRHQVASGETLWDIARRYGTTVSGIQQANGLQRAEMIQPGQTLSIPGRSKPSGTGTHRVEPGETVDGIARRYGTTVSAIQAANGLERVDLIRPGQTLSIPGGSTAARYRTHKVEQGQTVDGIARRYGTTPAAIQEANNLERIDLIRPGQVLRIPSG